MKRLRFGRWGSVLADHRHGDEITRRKTESLPPLASFPPNVIALMSGKGLLVFDNEFNFVPMIREYLAQIQAKYCCGKCITGIKGSKIVSVILDKMMQGGSAESDLDVLSRMADILNDAAKCSVCQSAGELLKDGLTFFRDDFLDAVRNGISENSVRYIGNISAPCMNTCPCHINIPGYVEMLQELRYEEALQIIHEEMPLPGITGRICPAPCEKACSVANMGDVAIPIKTLKRVAADYEMLHAIEPPFQRVELNGKPIAIVGAGPAGLAAAYYLNRFGHPVTVFEALPIPGGMVGVGIPPYRQPRDVLQKEIVQIQRLGVEFRFKARLGKDFTIQDLFDQGFKSVFLGVGAHKSSALALKEEKQRIKGVFSGGIDFLRDLNLGKKIQVGENAIIAGGGNTAIDCARTCLRMGASQVTVVYRRTEREMPADLEEVEDSREEGIKFLFLTQPVAVLSENGRMTGLRCIRMELGEPDRSGRRRPVPVEGTEFDLAGDTLIPAIGQIADLEWLSGDDNIQFSRKGAIKVDPVTMMTSRPGVFAAGDAVSGPLTVVHGLAGGKRAAHMIHQYVTTGSCKATEQQWMDDLIANIEKDYGVLVTARSPLREGGKVVRNKLDVHDRIGHFLEVDSGFTQKGSFIEASRCLRCFHLILAAVK